MTYFYKKKFLLITPFLISLIINYCFIANTTKKKDFIMKGRKKSFCRKINNNFLNQISNFLPTVNINKRFQKIEKQFQIENVKNINKLLTKTIFPNLLQFQSNFRAQIYKISSNEVVNRQRSDEFSMNFELSTLKTFLTIIQKPFYNTSIREYSNKSKKYQKLIKKYFFLRLKYFYIYRNNIVNTTANINLLTKKAQNKNSFRERRKSITLIEKMQMRLFDLNKTREQIIENMLLWNEISNIQNLDILMEREFKNLYIPNILSVKPITIDILISENELRKSILKLPQRTISLANLEFSILWNKTINYDNTVQIDKWQRSLRISFKIAKKNQNDRRKRGDVGAKIINYHKNITEIVKNKKSLTRSKKSANIILQANKNKIRQLEILLHSHLAYLKNIIKNEQIIEREFKAGLIREVDYVEAKRSIEENKLTCYSTLIELIETVYKMVGNKAFVRIKKKISLNYLMNNLDNIKKIFHIT